MTTTCINNSDRRNSSYAIRERPATTVRLPVEQTKKIYNEMLQLSQWKQKRILILKRDNYRCRHCKGTRLLQVHHRQYIYFKSNGLPLPPWKYKDNFLVTLCDTCHAAGHRLFRVPVFGI